MTFFEGIGKSIESGCLLDIDDIELPPEIEEKIRLFELDILSCSSSSAMHRANLSHYMGYFLEQKEMGILCIAVRLWQFFSEEDREGDAYVMRSYCLALNWIAEDIAAKDAPDIDATIADWFCWAVKKTGLQISAIQGGDNEEY